MNFGKHYYPCCVKQYLILTGYFRFTKQKCGYHILYKTKRCQPSQKVAKLENHTQAVIEIKGQKGML